MFENDDVIKSFQNQLCFYMSLYLLHSFFTVVFRVAFTYFVSGVQYVCWVLGSTAELSVTRLQKCLVLNGHWFAMLPHSVCSQSSFPSVVDEVLLRKCFNEPVSLNCILRVFYSWWVFVNSFIKYQTCITLRFCSAPWGFLLL